MSTTSKLRKTDRRTIYTQNVIKDALLELTAHQPYEKITVAQLCRQAEIARATFYLHYDNLDEVLDSVIDDALMFSNSQSGTVVDLLDVIRHGSLQQLKEHDDILPACQRIADSDKYHHLFMDSSISNYIIRRIADHERDAVVPDLMNRAHVSEDEAEMLFRFILNGTFAVNRSLGWKKDRRWYRYQKILSQFVNLGLN